MRTTAEIRPEMEAANTKAQALQAEFCEAYRAEEKAAKDEAKAKGTVNACEGYWRADGTCSYCGSMTVKTAIERLKTPGVHFSGADWKYGWPHKFYIGAHPGGSKLYNNHLKDATPEEFAEFAALAKAFFSIEWEKDEKGIKYKAVEGVQMFGHVGADGKPDHSLMRR